MKTLRIYDGAAAACLLILPPLLYAGLGDLTAAYGTAAWLVLLIAAAAALCLFLITSFLTRGNIKLLDAAAAVCGRPFAVLYGFVLCVYFSYHTGVYARESAAVLKAYGFNKTPFYVIAGIILLAALVMNLFGGRAVIKSAGFFFIALLAGIALVILLGLNRYEPAYLFPVSLNGIDPLEGLYKASFFSGAVLLALFSFGDGRALRRSGVISVLTAGGVSALLCVCYVMMFSRGAGAAMTCGFIEMGQSSYFNHFFYRFEAPLLLFVIFAAVMQASLGLLIAKESLVSVFKRCSHRGVVCAAAAAASAAALVLPDAPVKRYGVFIVAAPPVFLFIISCVKRIFK